MPRRYDLPAELWQAFDDFTANLGRANGLVSLYESTSGKGRGRKRVQEADVLRAAVVFSHAALEDFIRSICAFFYLHAPSAVLDEIPLVGLNSSGRPEKFFLGKLAEHRTKNVDEIIRVSVRAHLDRTTFNSSRDIAAAIQKCGLDLWTIDKLFPALDEMMRRRHQIVHRADKSPRTGSGKQHAESLSPVDVRIWLRAVANVFRGLWGNVLFRQRQLRQIPTSSDADAKLTTIRTIQARSKQRAGTPPLS